MCLLQPESPWALDLGRTAGKPLGHWLPSPHHVFLLLGNNGSVLLVILADVILHIILHLHVSLEDLVESCIPTALKGVVGFRCCPNPGFERCSSAVSRDTFLNKQKEEKCLDLFYNERHQMPLQKQPPRSTREHRETNRGDKGRPKLRHSFLPTALGWCAGCAAGCAAAGDHTRRQRGGGWKEQGLKRGHLHYLRPLQPGRK